MEQDNAELQRLIEKFKAYSPGVDATLLADAYKFSRDAHSAQKRASGEPYFTHCVAVADILLDHKLDIETVAAGLLHDVVEDTDYTAEEMEKLFGKDITHLVQGVTKISDLKFTTEDEKTAENWRKMLVAMAKDIRVVLIKIADRTHNMKTLSFLGDEKKIKQKAWETLNLYAPLAQRLGMFRIKTELEDLSFEYLAPAEYKKIVSDVEKKAGSRNTALESFKEKLTEVLKEERLECRILSRSKNYYSIYRKMKKQNLNVNQIQDSLGVRIITQSVGDCYRALGIVHSYFTPLAGSFTDYIGTPKNNMYQSIHTTVMDGEGDIIEIQIRTEDMHRTSEYGIAAHWRYKMGAAKKDKNFDEKINWLRQWIEWQQELTAPKEFLEGFTTDIALQQVFVFTPKAEVKSLPEGSTPLDFAYAIHGEIGDKYWGAKVNNKMVRMDYEFKTGDICEIITRNNMHPTIHWLDFAKTSRARSRIKRYLKEAHLSATQRMKK